MAVIKIYGGIEVLVNKSDLQLISGYKWHYNPKEKIAQSSVYIEQKVRHIKMHRLIMGVTDPLIKIDHKNRNKLDNRRRNLRIATMGQNARNTGKRKKGTYTSIYKGVFWHKYTNKWGAKIRINGKPKWLGGFEEEKQAAVAYDIAAINNFKEFACTNFPITNYQSSLK